MMIELIKVYLQFQFRNRQILIGTIFFSIFLIFLFTLAFPTVDPEQANLYSGIFWISSFFAGNLVLSNQTQLQANQFQQGLLLSGVDSFTLFFSKFFSSLIYMLFVQVIVLCVILFFFPTPSKGSLNEVVACMTLGSVGFMALGTLFYSLVEFQQVKDLLVTILFYPIIIPLFLFAHKGSIGILAGKGFSTSSILIGYDLIFVFLSALLYEFIIEDNV